MARPKHRTQPGKTYFVTTNTWQRREIFRQPQAAGILLGKLHEYRDKGFYQLHDYVIMPDHVHVLLTPGQDCSLEKAAQMFKGGSSREIGFKFPVWHPGFSEHWIRGREDYDQHVKYIRENPVKAGLVEQANGYAFSSTNCTLPLDPWPPAPEAKAQGQGEFVAAGLKPRPSDSQKSE